MPREILSWRRWTFWGVSRRGGARRGWEDRHSWRGGSGRLYRFRGNLRRNGRTVRWARPNAERHGRLQAGHHGHAVVRETQRWMPRAHVVIPGGNSIDTERACSSGLCKVGMIEHGDPGVGPWVLLAHYFYLGGLPEFVDQNDLAIIVEWSNADNLSGADVYEAIGVES